MKRFKILLTALAFSVLTAVSAAAYSDVYTHDDYYTAVNRLGSLGIINGYTDGTFRPADSVTREQFAKIIVCAVNKSEDSLAMGSYTCKFSDVSDGHWSIPYINYISGKEIIKGYADGSFGPSNTINYAEAATVICRLLGYTEENVGYFWPSNFTAKADSLGFRMSDKDIYAPLNRAEIAKMIDKALFTHVNPHAAQNGMMSYGKDTILLSAAGYSVVEDCFIIATYAEDDSLLSDQVKTSEGTYRATSATAMPAAGTSGTIVLNDDDRIVVSFTEPLYSMNIGVSNISDDKIEYVSGNGSKGTIRLDSALETYVDYTKTSFASAKQSITSGTDMTFYGFTEGDWEYAVINRDSVTPVLASHAYSDSDVTLEGTSINKTNLVVYRNGDTATLDDIEANDVVYYNTRTNIMDVYSKKVTGIYYEAHPSKAYVTSVTVGGREYTIGSVSATNSLGVSAGAYNIGDKITLLLGKNDKIIFVASLNGFNESEYGILLSTSVKVKDSGDDEGKSEYTATILMSDGDEYEYVTDKDYDDYKGELVKLSFENSFTVLSKINKSSGIYGEFNPSKYTLGNNSLSDDIVIFQLISDSENSPAVAEILDIRVLEQATLPSDYVLGTVAENSFGDIRILYVKNLTDSAYTYGVLLSTSKPKGDSTTTSYKILVNGNEATYTSPSYKTVNAGPVMFSLEDEKIDEIRSLYKYATAQSIAAVDGARIKLGAATYPVSTNVIVYCKTGTYTYEQMAFSELETADISKVEIYSDKSTSSEGSIKAIIVTQ